jgi:hypothetical protein
MLFQASIQLVTCITKAVSEGAGGGSQTKYDTWELPGISRAELERKIKRKGLPVLTDPSRDLRSNREQIGQRCPKQTKITKACTCPQSPSSAYPLS